MANKAYKVVIVEGEDFEVGVFDVINKFYFKEKIKLIALPAGKNIYMLWKELKKDSYQTDIVEILRETNFNARQILDGLSRDDIDEIYLFFDFDRHQDNLSATMDASPDEVIKEMLDIFDNETELGKLYINYPMIESIRDFSNITCNPWTSDCIWDLTRGDQYKTVSGDNNKKTQLGKYNIDDWRDLISFFLMRVGCLFDYNRIPEYAFYRKNIDAKTIYEQQKEKYIKDNKVFILSAIPEFLLDYHKEEFWRGMVRTRKKLKPNNNCIK